VVQESVLAPSIIADWVLRKIFYSYTKSGSFRVCKFSKLFCFFRFLFLFFRLDTGTSITLQCGGRQPEGISTQRSVLSIRTLRQLRFPSTQWHLPVDVDDEKRRSNLDNCKQNHAHDVSCAFGSAWYGCRAEYQQNHTVEKE